MAKLTVMIEGTTEELAPVLQQLAEFRGLESVSRVTEGEKILEEQPKLLVWTEESVRKVWYHLSLDCQKVLKEVVKHRDGISSSELQEKVNMGGYELGGSLSSLGHQLRNCNFLDLSYPLEWTTSAGYRLNLVWRETIKKIEEESDNN